MINHLDLVKENTYMIRKNYGLTTKHYKYHAMRRINKQGPGELLEPMNEVKGNP